MTLLQHLLPVLALAVALIHAAVSPSRRDRLPAVLAEHRVTDGAPTP